MTPIYTMLAGLGAGFALAVICHLAVLLWKARRPSHRNGTEKTPYDVPTYTTPAGPAYERPVEAPAEDLIDDFEEQVQETVDDMSITPDVNDLHDAALWAKQALDAAKATE